MVCAAVLWPTSAAEQLSLQATHRASHRLQAVYGKPTMWFGSVAIAVPGLGSQDPSDDATDEPTGSLKHGGGRYQADAATNS
jgi:hypothetical protein